MNNLMRTVALAATVMAVGGLGYLGGRWLGPSSNQPTAAIPMVRTGLLEGTRFPDVRLAAASGEEATLAAWASGHDVTVLFLDPQCSPCGDAVERWQSRIDAGQIRTEEVVGIAEQSSAEIAQYREEKGLSFAILRDVEFTFRETYGVDVFPYEVSVDRDQIIRQAGLSRY